MTQSLADKYIVAIDDTHSILTFLRISLEALGVKFQGAATASGGLALCESTKPDLVVLDLGLPDKEGFDILPRLKRIDKERNMPVVVLTVRNGQEARDAAASLGADAYLTKPFVMDDLIDVIRNKLQERDAGMRPRTGGSGGASAGTSGGAAHAREMAPENDNTPRQAR